MEPPIAPEDVFDAREIPVTRDHHEIFRPEWLTQLHLKCVTWRQQHPSGQMPDAIVFTDAQAEAYRSVLKSYGVREGLWFEGIPKIRQPTPPSN